MSQSPLGKRHERLVLIENDQCSLFRTRREKWREWNRRRMRVKVVLNMQKTIAETRSIKSKIGHEPWKVTIPTLQPDRIGQPSQIVGNAVQLVLPHHRRNHIVNVEWMVCGCNLESCLLHCFLMANLCNTTISSSLQSHNHSNRFCLGQAEWCLSSRLSNNLNSPSRQDQ